MRDLFSFRRMATRLWTISPRVNSWCSLVFAKDTIEQYTAPSSETVVDIIVRWYLRKVVEGGRKEKMLQQPGSAGSIDRLCRRPTMLQLHHKIPKGADAR